MSDPFAPFRLTGRTALVTGARREIGRAIALGLAGAGARLAIHHAGTAEETSDAASVVQEIQAVQKNGDPVTQARKNRVLQTLDRVRSDDFQSPDQVAPGGVNLCQFQRQRGGVLGGDRLF